MTCGGYSSHHRPISVEFTGFDGQGEIGGISIRPRRSKSLELCSCLRRLALTRRSGELLEDGKRSTEIAEANTGEVVLSVHD
jgi:hypothetical protein